MDLKKRLGIIIQKDKSSNPKYLIDVIKSDIYYLINNYFEVDFEDIKVEINVEEDKYKIDVNCLGERLKTMKVLPE